MISIGIRRDGGSRAPSTYGSPEHRRRIAEGVKRAKMVKAKPKPVKRLRKVPSMAKLQSTRIIPANRRSVQGVNTNGMLAKTPKRR